MSDSVLCNVPDRVKIQFVYKQTDPTCKTDPVKHIFQPERGTKRKKGNDENDANSRKIKVGSLLEEKFSSKAELTEEEREKILEMVENEPEVETLDVGSLRRMLLAFEKKVTKNQEMRIKYPDLPEKYDTQHCLLLPRNCLKKIENNKKIHNLL